MNASPRFSAWAVRLDGAPGWFRGLVLLMFGAALAGLCWWIALQDLHLAMPAKSPVRKEDEVQLTERRAAVQKAEGELAWLHLKKEQLAALEGVLPGRDDAQGAWAAVHRASRTHGLRMEQFKPGPVGSEVPYPQQRAALRLSGSFDALLAFTRTLAEMDSSVGIESYLLVNSANSANSASSASVGAVAGTHGSGTDSGSGNLILEATLLSLHRPAATPTPAASTALVTVSSSAAGRSDSPPAAVLSLRLPSTPGDPFEIQRLASASDPAAANALNSHPLSAMRMVGSVRALDPAAALTALVLIGGTLYPVRLGDALGNAKGRVAEIRVDALTVREPGLSGAAQPARTATLVIAKD